MVYGDFSSLVQLGVGLHLGAALLQSYGEIGIQPVNRSLARIRSLVVDNSTNKADAIEKLEMLESDFDIFRIKRFNNYKGHILFNSIICLFLVLLLAYISFYFQVTISPKFASFVAAISVAPCIISLFLHWIDTSKALRPLRTRAEALEKIALGIGG